MIIMGIDPGLHATGFGLIRASGMQLSIMAAGDIRPPKGLTLSARLGNIHEELENLIRLYRPDTAVLEKVFTHYRHVTTATLMAHARGVACLAVQEQGVVMAEYPPTRVKHALTGRGNASKEQVARMVTQWIGHHDPAWSRDATDALALAIVHAHMEANRRGLASCAASSGS
jgi:crossover junction endodeoxyribonuclease RuvC